jgi:hypothetical protein
MANTTKDEVLRRRLLVKCEDYTPAHGHWRCLSYVKGGSCSRDDYFMCVEWVKNNPGYELAPLRPVPTPKPERKESTERRSTRDRPVEPSEDESYQPPPLRAGERSGTVYDLGSLGKKVAGEKRIMLERPELLTEHAIEQLSKQGYEVTVTSSNGTTITIVPSYTDADRAELTYRDARTLVMVLQVFPDATIESLRKPDKEAS